MEIDGGLVGTAIGRWLDGTLDKGMRGGAVDTDNYICIYVYTC